MKDKFINFRASEKEKKQLAILAKKAKMSQAEFIRHAVFNKEIVVIDGLKPLQMELKRIGNNLNQLTTRSNMGHFSVIDLQETKEQLGKIHERLSELCATKDEQAHPEIEYINKPDAPIQCISTEDECLNRIALHKIRLNKTFCQNTNLNLESEEATAFSAMPLIEIEVTNMATVNFIKYKTQRAATLRGVIAYVCQREKTGIARENLDTKHQVRSDNQQCEMKLISGLNCTPETAYAEFISTKASYHKTDGLQFYHYTQSFKDGENISPKIAHEIAMKFAEEHYKDFEVLIATHMDNDHLHSHFIINSVSFETGKKLHQPPNTLRKLRLTSDNICKEYGLSTLETYTYGRSKTIGRTERRAREHGTSWKFQLCLTIETAMKKAKTKDEFIAEMRNLGYEGKWEDGRQAITYTCPNGKKVRDDKLYGRKYLKENMTIEFKIRQQDFTSDIKTGWEYEREELYKPQTKPTKALTLEVGKEILYTLNQYEQAQNYDDELAEIANLTALTALSFVGVYAFIELMNSLKKDELTLTKLDNIIEELKQEPENTQEFEEEQEQDFTMTMEGY